jgi:hypothetical protein
VRRECLDHLLITGRQLLRVLHVYVEHYNRHRPHRGLGLSAPEPSACCDQADPSAAARQLRRRDVLGGLIHEYERAAWQPTDFWHPTGRIVAEVLIGLLQGDPTSYLRLAPTWKPPGKVGDRPIGRPGNITMADLLKFATR